MAVFRAPKDKNKSIPDKSSRDDANFYERQQLSDQNQRFDDNPLAYQPSDDEIERQSLNEANQTSGPNPESSSKQVSSPQDQGQSSSSLSTATNAINKINSTKSLASRAPMLLAVGTFLMPTIIGLFLFILAMQTGFTLEHITRVTTGLRFGRFHYQMSKRFNHLRGEYLGLANSHNLDVNNIDSRIAPYTRTTVGQRLLGTSPQAIVQNLTDKGYNFEYKQLSGPLSTRGRLTITSITTPDGKEIPIKSLKDGRAFIQSIPGDFDDTNFSRYRALRTQFLLAKRMGIPFARFTVVLDKLKKSKTPVQTRGSPAETIDVKQGVSEDILDDKARIAKKTGLLTRIKRLGGEGLVDEAKDDFKDGKTKAEAEAEVRRKLKKSASIAKGASYASLAVTLATFACVIREIGEALEGAYHMKIGGLQDNAATLLTTTSQIKAGDMQTEVVGDLTQRFNGFATSANYQAGILNEDLGDYMGTTADFSDDFAADSVFDGWLSKTIFTFSQALSPSNLLRIAKEVVARTFPGAIQLAEFTTGAIEGVLGWFGWDVSLEDQLIDTINNVFDYICGLVLNPWFQGFIAIAEMVVLIITIALTGGVTGGAFAAIKAIIPTLLRVGLTELVLGLTMDYILFNLLLPSLVTAGSGLDTALTSDPDNPQNGARNFASLDYGMHYLKEGEALGMGGSRVPVEYEVAQTYNYLSQRQLAYANKGVWNNIFSLNNPYSSVSSFMVAQNGNYGLSYKSQTYVAGLFGRLASNLDFSPTVQAQEPISTEALADFWYPGQTHVIGFDDSELEGTKEEFNHIDNAIHVDENFDDYKSKYAQCLSISASEYMLSQAGVDSETYYPSECDSDEEARRYKLYYQDCQLADSLYRWGSNTSPMYSNTCDFMLPDNDTGDALALEEDTDVPDIINNLQVSNAVWEPETPSIEFNNSSTDLDGLNKPTPQPIWSINLGVL